MKITPDIIPSGIINKDIVLSRNFEMIEKQGIKDVEPKVDAKTTYNNYEWHA